MGVILVNSFASNAAAVVLLYVAALLFVVFNLTWVPSKWAKLLYLVPLLASYVIYFTSNHKFGDYQATS